MRLQLTAVKVLDSYDGCGVAEAAEQPGNSQAGR